MEEAVSRATEMGKPVHASPGLELVAFVDPQVIMGITMVGHVASLCAKYEAELIATTMHNTLFPVMQETVRMAYRAAGKEQLVRETTCRFLSDSVQAYVTGVNGILEREQCAANIIVGQSIDWSILVTARVPALNLDCMQIAGTPKFGNNTHYMATCDYVLLGEECYAAEAYITQDPGQLSALYAEDVLKFAVLALGLVGYLFMTVGIDLIIKLIEL
jgi:hypothetical protein